MMSLSDLVTIEDNVIKSILPLNNLSLSLADLIIYALEKGGNKTLLINAQTGQRRTYKEVLSFIKRAVTVLKSQGVSKGDVVFFHIEQDDVYSLLLLSATMLGAVVSSSPFGGKLDHLLPRIKVAEAKFAFLDEMSFVACSGKTLSCRLVLISDVKEMIDDAVEADLESDMVDKSPDDSFMIGFTSGSTGEPKAIRITDAYVVGAINVSNTKFLGSFEGEFVYGVETNFHHVICLTYFVILLLAEVEIVLYECNDWYKGLVVKYINKYKITSVRIASCTIPSILQAAKTENIDISSLQYIHAGGSMLPSDDIVNQFIGLFPRLKHFQSGYGQSESGCVTLQPFFMPNSDYRSSGVPLPGASYKIIDRKSGMKLGPNAVGEIFVKTTQQSAASYLTDGNNHLDSQGYFKTGDAGYYTTDGRLFITGRYKELICCDRYEVFPAEFECSIASHPSVKEVAVIAVDHPEFGQTAKAFVVLTSEAIKNNQSEQQLIDYHNSRVEVYYKELKGGITFVDALPRTSNGKVDKKKLSTGEYKN